MAQGKKSLFFVFISAFFLSGLVAQTSRVSINIKDQDNVPLPGAPVQLINAVDSSLVFSVTNIEGYVYFEEVEDGMYELNISYIGFKPIETSLRITSELRTFEFIMSTDAISLGGVTIVARKPLIRQEDDKMIIDPEPIAGITTNTLEVLESTPGLYVDQDGGIFLTSATPATVYINGREQKMSTQDINTILRSLPPHSVDRIEVLRTPSTKYDASSSGGIINIILKKGVKIGRFGSVNGGMNQGVYGNRFIGFSFNNSGDKSTSYINFNYNNNDRLEEINAVRFLNADTALDQESKSVISNHQLYVGYGVNYDINPTLSFNYDGRVNASNRNTDADNKTLIQSFNNLETLSEIDNFVNNTSLFLNLQQDFGLLWKLDTLGSELDTKFSYSFNTNASTQKYTTEYIQPLVFEYSGEGENDQNRHFFIFQSDLTKHLPWKIKIETGIKSSYQQYDSKSDYYINYNGTQIGDTQRTNSFHYLENINAAYVQASRNLFAGLILKAGVRMEHTNMQGFQTIPDDTSFVVNRADWFPYVYLSRKLFDIMGIELFGYMIYRKTISRPGYQDLNPYVRYVDQFMYESGNPALKPQFTENIELNISFNDMPVFAVGRNNTKDIFSMVMYNDENQQGVLVRTYDNLGFSKETYFRGILGIPPGGKYFFAIGAQYNLLEYDGFYENEPLTFTNGSWRLFTFHSLNLHKETKLTVSGFMMTNGQWNFYELKNFGQLNVGLSQNFFNKKLTVTINARDILRTMVTEFEFNQGSIYSYGNRYTDNRRFGINIRYNFGIKTKEERRGLPGFEEPEM